MSTTVTYKGATLTTVDNTTKTLNTRGTYLEDNITLTDVSGGFVTQDQDGFIVLPPDGGASPQGGGLEYETGTVVLTANSSTMSITFSNSHDAAPIFFMIAENGGAYPSVASGTDVYAYVYSNWADCFGNSIYATETSSFAGMADWRYKTRKSTNFSVANINWQTTSAEANITSTGVSLDVSSGRQVWAANFQYKWIAVWKPTT